MPQGRIGGGGGIIDVNDLPQAGNARRASTYRLRAGKLYAVEDAPEDVLPPVTTRRFAAAGPLYYQRFTAGSRAVGAAIFKGFNSDPALGQLVGDAVDQIYGADYETFVAAPRAFNLAALEFGYSTFDNQEEVLFTFDSNPWADNRANFLADWRVDANITGAEADLWIFNNTRGTRLAVDLDFLPEKIGTDYFEWKIQSGQLLDGLTELDMARFRGSMQTGDDIEIFVIPWSAANAHIGVDTALPVHSNLQEARFGALFHARIHAETIQSGGGKGLLLSSQVASSGAVDFQDYMAYGAMFASDLVAHPNPDMRLVMAAIRLSAPNNGIDLFWSGVPTADELADPWRTALSAAGTRIDGDLWFINATRGGEIGFSLSGSALQTRNVPVGRGISIFDNTHWIGGTTAASIAAFIAAIQEGDAIDIFIVTRQGADLTRTFEESFRDAGADQSATLTAYAHDSYEGLLAAPPDNPSRGEYYLDSRDELFYQWGYKTGRHALGWVQKPIVEIDDTVAGFQGIRADEATAIRWLTQNDELVAHGGTLFRASDFIAGRDLIRIPSWNELESAAPVSPTVTLPGFFNNPTAYFWGKGASERFPESHSVTGTPAGSSDLVLLQFKGNVPDERHYTGADFLSEGIFYTPAEVSSDMDDIGGVGPNPKAVSHIVFGKNMGGKTWDIDCVFLSNLGGDADLNFSLRKIESGTDDLAIALGLVRTSTSSIAGQNVGVGGEISIKDLTIAANEQYYLVIAGVSTSGNVNMRLNMRVRQTG